MKVSYQENPGTDKKRKKRSEKKRKHTFGKFLLTLFSMVVIAIAAFVATVKIAAPQTALVAYIPTQAVQFVEEQVLGKTTTAPATTVTTTTQRVEDYLPIEDFAVKAEKAGNQLGTLLNGGMVGTDYTYLYFIAEGKGIYRFVPGSESYTCIYPTADALSGLNLKGDYLYFIHEPNGTLQRLKKGSKQPEALAENVAFVYVYDKKIYYVTRDNRLCLRMNDAAESQVLYTADGVLRFVGISLYGAYFTVQEPDGLYHFLSVADTGGKATCFRKDAMPEDCDKLVMENGFMYYYRLYGNSGEPALYRRKFGSQFEVMLEEHPDAGNYPITEKNRLFYATLEDGVFSMKERNMNTDAVKTMLYVQNVSGNHTLRIYHGGEYDLIIGHSSPESEMKYYASSQYTGSSNIMKFKNGHWSY